MDERAVRALQFVTLQLVGAVAVVHFTVGSEQLASIATNGLLGEYMTGIVLERPRPLLFVVSSLAVLGGIVATARGWIDRRTAYQLGALTMVTYLVGWVAWHTVLNHGLALGGGGSGAVDAHSHGGFFGTLVSHYVEPLVDVVAASASPTGTGRTLLGIVSKTLELAALALLIVLLRVDPAARDGGIDLSLGLERPER